MLETSERGRPYRGSFYGLLLLAGLLFMSYPVQGLKQADQIRWVWSGFIVAGTLFSLYGVMRDHWRMEWYGLPLQASSILGLTYVVVAGGTTTARYGFACLLGALILPMLHRFVVLYRLAKASKKMIDTVKGGEVPE